MSRIYLRLAFLARRAPAILWSDAVACSAVSNGPDVPAALEILHAFPKRRVHAAVDERLRRHDDSALLFLDLKVVAGLEPETVVQLLGDHDLAAHAQLDGSRCFGLCFHIFVYYNWREHRSTVRSVATMLPRLGSIRGDSRRREGTSAWLERDD